MELILTIPIMLSFFLVLFLVPIWIKKMKQIGLTWKDMHKPSHLENIAGSGGVVVIMAFIFGVLSYISIKTFILKTDTTTIEIFALLTTLLIASLIGFIDDVFGWIHGGLSARFRIFLLFFSAVPLMVINAGESTMMGMEFGLFYPLFFIPLGIIGASATFNFLAGYNGLETSQGILILSALAVVTWIRDDTWLSLIALIMGVCLAAFYVFNKYPAKIFPGDSLTYPIGALIAIIAILGNTEKVAVFFFIPYILETGLKIRGKLKKASFARLEKDGSLNVPYDKFYGLEHISIYLLKKIKKNKGVYEKEVVCLINLFQVAVIILGFILLFLGVLS